MNTRILLTAGLILASCGGDDGNGSTSSGVMQDAAHMVCATCRADSGDSADSADSGSITLTDAGAADGTDGGASDGAGSTQDAARPLCTNCETSCEEKVTNTSANHVEGDLVYSDPPPAGGDHNGCWADFGVHTEEVRAENWVHNLEHGAVVLLYNCPAGCDAERAALEGFAVGRDFALVTPYSEMPYTFAIVSWGYRLVADCLDMDAFAAFYDIHADHAPESISSNPPASCP